MNYHNYILQPYEGQKSRHICPQCGKREFTLYIDIESGEFLSDYVGRCNREISCGYHYPPKEFFLTNGMQKEFKPITPKKEIVKPTSYIDESLFKSSLKGYAENYFIQFLINKFGSQIATKLIETYYIGTKENGTTVFWQIDDSGKIRTGKIMLYNPENGKRVKGEYNHINWVHSKINDFNLKQCLFGEHLIKDSKKPIAIVESEKTAIICSAYLPQYTWVATGGINNLKVDKCKSLKGRNVVLFPDLGGFDKWQIKAEEIKTICFVRVSDLLEKNASSEAKNKGYDLADFLLNFQIKEFHIKRPYESYTKEERLKFGLSIFKKEDLKNLARKIANDWLEQHELMALLQKDLCYNDAEDLIDIMCIKKVLEIKGLKYKIAN